MTIISILCNVESPFCRMVKKEKLVKKKSIMSMYQNIAWENRLEFFKKADMDIVIKITKSRSITACEKKIC